MKIDRLIGILSILLQQEKVTAPYLAETFEVSKRTINRDIEALLKAGIPLVTYQGQNGGVSIMSGYKLDRTLLTSSEMQSILTGLKSLDSVAGTNRYRQLMEKLSSGAYSVQAEENNIYIDLSSWYGDSLRPKIELMKKAIEEEGVISFSYYAPDGETKRIIEPYLLVFQWSSWYVWGYCLKREDYRLFKLNRIQDLRLTGEKRKGRKVVPYDPSPVKPFPRKLPVTVLCEPELKWRLVDEYGTSSFTVREDLKLIFKGEFASKESLFGWLLSLGGKAKLLEPSELQAELARIALEIYHKYSCTGF